MPNSGAKRLMTCIPHPILWFIDSTSLSLAHPSLLRRWYGALPVRLSAQQETKLSSDSRAYGKRERCKQTALTNSVKARICLPPLELVVQSEASLAVHRLRSLASCSYAHPGRWLNSILMWLQQSNYIFNMWVDIMRPAFNSEPKYRYAAVSTDPVSAVYSDPKKNGKKLNKQRVIEFQNARQARTDRNMVKSRSPNAPSTWFICLYPRTHACPQNLPSILLLAFSLFALVAALSQCLWF
jgi:hypothetical protein